MSRLSRKFKVPDPLANLYDFANSLDLRHFVHHGMQHREADELAGPRELGAWMSRRGLLFTGAGITPAMFEAALDLRSSVRDYLQRDPADRRKGMDAVRSLNAAASVLGSSGAIFLAIYLGLRATLLIGGALYLCALAVILATRGHRVRA